MSRNKIAAAHQSHYLPWLGYIDKINKADFFCLVDTLKFEPEKFQHQNKIKTKDGELMLSIPYTSDSEGSLIKDVYIENKKNWSKKHLNSIESAYEDAPFFEDYIETIRETYNRKWSKLVDINTHMLEKILGLLDIDTRLLSSSDLKNKTHDQNLLVRASKEVGATTYMSGVGGNCTQLDLMELEKAGITHVQQSFKHPVYPQLHGEFISNLCVLDLLFNCGAKSKDYIIYG